MRVGLLAIGATAGLMLPHVGSAEPAYDAVNIYAYVTSQDFPNYADVIDVTFLLNRKTGGVLVCRRSRCNDTVSRSLGLDLENGDYKFATVREYVRARGAGEDIVGVQSSGGTSTPISGRALNFPMIEIIEQGSGRIISLGCAARRDSAMSDVKLQCMLIPGGSPADVGRP